MLFPKYAELDSFGRRTRPGVDVPVVLQPAVFHGALVGYGFETGRPKQSEEYTFPVASGVVAGGSLMAVILIFWENGPQIAHQFIQQLFHR